MSGVNCNLQVFYYARAASADGRSASLFAGIYNSNSPKFNPPLILRVENDHHLHALPSPYLPILQLPFNCMNQGLPKVNRVPCGGATAVMFPRAASLNRDGRARRVSCELGDYSACAHARAYACMQMAGERRGLIKRRRNARCTANRLRI